ncbi:MAG TPA: hypothetical protein PLB16_11000, partial [bacterium]|nr:hypothetical protein [bacterium]
MMRIVTLLTTVFALFLFFSCDEKKSNTNESAVTVTAAYVENGETIVVEGTNFGKTAPTATLTKVEE